MGKNFEMSCPIDLDVKKSAETFQNWPNLGVLGSGVESG